MDLVYRFRMSLYEPKKNILASETKREMSFSFIIWMSLCTLLVAKD